ncbi:hypothetical protein PVAP13_3KG155200 [Panicum virgatum]|uniref:Uncharacterized protein n=1 Tax=Panicum virgatum TaxID=38727 RepID=A0A8T0UVC0_PANVG|nr:hypothetical protein PVAP13_3KG155200 [Panicum virgatum]
MRTQPVQVHSSTSGLPCRPLDVYLDAIGSGSSVTSAEIWQALYCARALFLGKLAWQDNKSKERDGTRRQATWGPRPDSPIQHELELNMACRDVPSRSSASPPRAQLSIDCSVDAAAVHARWHWTGTHTQYIYSWVNDRNASPAWWITLKGDPPAFQPSPEWKAGLRLNS